MDYSELEISTPMNCSYINAKIELIKSKQEGAKYWLNFSFVAWITFTIGTHPGVYEQFKADSALPGFFGGFSFVAFMGLKIMMFISLFGVVYYLRECEKYEQKIISLQKKKLELLKISYWYN